MPRPEHVKAELRPGCEPGRRSPHRPQVVQLSNPSLSFRDSLLGILRAGRREQLCPEPEQLARHYQPVGPALKPRAIILQSRHELVDNGEDRQPAEVELVAAHHLQQEVERSLEALDVEMRRIGRPGLAARRFVLLPPIVQRGLRTDLSHDAPWPSGRPLPDC